MSRYDLVNTENRLRSSSLLHSSCKNELLPMRIVCERMLLIRVRLGKY